MDSGQSHVDAARETGVGRKYEVFLSTVHVSDM